MSRLKLILFLLLNSWITSLFALTASVDVLNVSDNLRQDIQANLSIYHAIDSTDLSIERLEAYHKLAEEEILDTLAALGWNHATVKSHQAFNNDHYHAQYTITLNKPTLVRSIKLQFEGPGKNVKALTQYKPSKRIKLGSQMYHEAYEDLKQDIIATAHAEGFLRAHFSKKALQLSLKKHAAYIQLTLNTGPQYLLGPITFNKTDYKPESVQALVPFTLYEPYNTNKLNDFQQNLVNNNFFQSVTIDPQPNFQNQEDLVVPIQVSVTPKPKTKYIASIGYGTDTRCRGHLGWQRRLPNHPGHRINTDLYGAHHHIQATLKYTWPGKRPLIDLLSSQLKFKQENFDDSYSRLYELGFNSFQKRGNMTQQWQVRYLGESFQKSPIAPRQRSYFLLPTGIFSWHSETEQVPFTIGHSAHLTLRAGLGLLLSSTSLFQSELKLKQIYPLSAKSRILLHQNIGATFVSNFNELPLSLRYFAGGDNSVRGYKYKSLGPKEYDLTLDKSVVVGGKHLILAGLELEHMLTEQLGIATFFDLGDAKNEFNFNLAAGAGAGLRFSTPLGNLRFDLARGLHKKVNNKWRVHLTFGTDL